MTREALCLKLQRTSPMQWPGCRLANRMWCCAATMSCAHIRPPRLSDLHCGVLVALLMSSIATMRTEVLRVDCRWRCGKVWKYWYAHPRAMERDAVLGSRRGS